MKALILAAGQGKRLEPLTKTQPKVMLPLVGKPLLEHILIEVKKAGIEQVTIITGYLEEEIKKYFGDGKSLGMKIEYITQKERLGTAHAVAQSSFDTDFLVLNGDTLVKAEDIKKLISQHQGGATIAVKPSESPELYGVVEVEDGFVKSIEEKPENPRSNLVSTGIYVFSPDIYSAIEKTELSDRGEYELPESIKILMQTTRVKAVEISEFIDIGTPWGYLEANALVMERVPPRVEGEIEDGARVKGKLILEEGAVVKAGSYIEGHVYIGRNSTVGPNCYLRGFATIGKNCRVGNAVEIKNSIIMDGTNVPHLNYIGDSIVGRNCNFGAGAKVGNLRLDNAEVKVYLKGRLTPTGRRKFGAILGDNVKLGLNVMINAGRKIGVNAKVGPGVVVYRDIPDNTTVIMKQELEFR